MRFRVILIGLIAIFPALWLGHLFAGGRAPAGVGAARTPVLIELFTSESCSSCPPADALLEKLDRSQPVSTADLVVLSEHVDYWDDIGWKDPYSSREFSIRQRDYAHRFRLDGPYTPQMVVDGDAQLVGSDERQALRVIGSAAKVDKIPVSLSSIRLEGISSLVLHVEVGPPLGAKPTSGQVSIALADDSDQSNVRRGENAGRFLTHVAVVRTLTQVGMIDGRATFSKDVRVNTGNANLHNLRVVAIVQETTAGRVLGVGSARLSN
jgi:hypothetical protein